MLQALVALTDLSLEERPLLKVRVLPRAHMTWPQDYLPLSGRSFKTDRDPTKLLRDADCPEQAEELLGRMQLVDPPLQAGDVLFYSSFTMTSVDPVSHEILLGNPRGACVALSPLLVPVGPQGQCEVTNSPEEVQAAACQDRLPPKDTFSGAALFETDPCRQAPHLVPTQPPQFFGWGRYLTGASECWVLCRC
jgi:hypothetical protein